MILLSFGLDFNVIFNNLYSPLAIIAATLFLVCRTDKKWILCFIVFILSVMFCDGLQNKSWSYHSSGYFIALCLLCFKSREIKLSHYIIIVVLITVEAFIRGAFFEPNKIYDRHGNSKGGSGLSNWSLEKLPDINDSEKLLYLTYGTDYSRFGYPFECEFFSAHYIQRVNYNKLINSMYLTDYYECVMSYNGKYIIYDSKWMKLKKNKHKELLDKVCSEYGVLESNKKVLIRGGKDKSHCN
ncbi:hypothetical protein JCM19240_6058 [Vibrio maritimus]|uniref:Uncharacterized protein n=1 Tax=Vibrio maritimus TaxID=990268 RepID=A0A090SY74_9VIBR|nr:hypothetical protein JCM19240_6058 [Vibrio maritimus]